MVDQWHIAEDDRHRETLIDKTVYVLDDKHETAQ